MGIEWPVCVPGLGVSIMMAGGQKVTCHLQVDWMYLEVVMELTTLTEGGSEERGLLVSLAHATDPQMALSCLVVTEDVKVCLYSYQCSGKLVISTGA